VPDKRVRNEDVIVDLVCHKSGTLELSVHDHLGRAVKSCGETAADPYELQPHPGACTRYIRTRRFSRSLNLLPPAVTCRTGTATASRSPNAARGESRRFGTRTRGMRTALDRSESGVTIR
jgi:hypothetical protein